MRTFFELGPKPLYGAQPSVFIALATESLQARVQSGGQLHVGPECQNLAELEAQVDEMKAELDRIVIEAKGSFGSVK